jgi:alanine dehydrogenase
MIIGIPTEVKKDEHRVAAVPAGVHQFVHAGHQVVVQADAGVGSSFDNDAYRDAGATIVDTAQDVFQQADMIIKVKEPQPEEYPLIRENQIVFTYYHFAASRNLTQGMIDTGAICIAYETIERPDRSLPLLTPMSEVAGRMAIQEGAKCLEKSMGGRGILLSGVPGVQPANVVILGGGVVGTNAAKMAAGLGANVTILDVNLDRLRQLDDIMPANVTTVFSNPYNILEAVKLADLVVGAVLISGAKAPILVPRAYLSEMKPGSVVVDVAVDQGGCIETTKPTTHSDPTFVVDGVVHYGVANMPGGVSNTSTLALTNATTPYALQLAAEGWRGACQRDESIRLGLNVVHGEVTFQPVANEFNFAYTPVESVLS